VVCIAECVVPVVWDTADAVVFDAAEVGVVVVDAVASDAAGADAVVVDAVAGASLVYVAV